MAPSDGQDFKSILSRFDVSRVSRIANDCLGRIDGNIGLSGAYRWLITHFEELDEARIESLLTRFSKLSTIQLSECVYLVHRYGSERLLGKVSQVADLYKTAGPVFDRGDEYGSQALIALMGLESRQEIYTPTAQLAFHGAVDVLLSTGEVHPNLHQSLRGFSDRMFLPGDMKLRVKLKRLAEAVVSSEGSTQFQKWLDDLGPPEVQPKRKTETRVRPTIKSRKQ